MRWMAIDHGTKRIGIALCDPTETVTTPHSVLPNEGEKTVERLASLAREESVEAIVVGLPKHGDGQESATAPAVRRFTAALAEALPSGMPVRLWEEALSTVEAERMMARKGIKREERKKRLDAFAAALILEDLLATRRQKRIAADSPDM